MSEPKRRRQKDKPISVSWTSHYTPTRVHYVREVAVTGLAAVALDRSVMVFSMSTLCGLEVPTEPEPRFGDYIEGEPATCGHCAALYAKLPHTHKPTP